MLGHRLGSRCVAYPVMSPPRMVEVRAPGPGRALARCLDALRDRMPRMEMFDGPVGIPVAASATAIHYYRATYAWHMAETRGAVLPAGRGVVAVALVLVGPDGRLLWQRRAQGLFLGGWWDVAAAGSWQPGEDIADAALREATEELGVPRGQLGAPAGMWVVPGPAPRGVTLVVRRRLARIPVLVPDAREVAQLRWSHGHVDLPAPGLWPMRLAALRAAAVVP